MNSFRFPRTAEVIDGAIRAKRSINGIIDRVGDARFPNVPPWDSSAAKAWNCLFNKGVMSLWVNSLDWLTGNGYTKSSGLMDVWYSVNELLNLLGIWTRARHCHHRSQWSFESYDFFYCMVESSATLCFPDFEGRNSASLST